MFNPISHADFDYVRRLIEKKSGVKIAEDKLALVENRLRSRLHILKLETYSDYIDYIREHEFEESQYFVDVLTTHTTHFFRESKHFDLLKDYIQEGNLPFDERLNVWCAACSTGEEPYTLAMVLEEIRSNIEHFDYRILASDVSDPTLAAAEEGVFDANRISEIPPDLLAKYFKQNASRTKIKAKPILRDKIKFRNINLAEPDFCAPIKFDIIFLRNVLIYFDEQLIERIALRMHDGLKKNGLLFIGFSENIGNAREIFEDLDISVFKRSK